MPINDDSNNNLVLRLYISKLTSNGWVNIKNIAN